MIIIIINSLLNPIGLGVDLLERNDLKVSEVYSLLGLPEIILIMKTLRMELARQRA